MTFKRFFLVLSVFAFSYAQLDGDNPIQEVEDNNIEEEIIEDIPSEPIDESLRMNYTYSPNIWFASDDLTPNARAGEEPSWNYDVADLDAGPLAWSKKWPYCNGFIQTPINIEDLDVTKGSNPTVVFSYWRKSVNSVKIINNQHTAVYIPSFAETRTNNTMTCCNNRQTYIFHSIHIHWGSDCEGGSEHTINGHRFAGEIHVVHYNRKYKSIDEALNYSDGLGVVGIMLEKAIESTFDHRNDNRFTKYLDLILDASAGAKEATVVDSPGIFTLEQLLRHPITDYYMYKGSLTTPPCNDGIVQWVVSTKPIKIYPSELAKLRSLIGAEGPIEYNFRPLQTRHGRTVTCC